VAKQNLLVVDADPRSLRVLEVSLRNAGYNVAGCPSVGKAFEILHANKPDLILSDTTFSDMNGFDFVEQLRQNDDWADIPFMFLSSDGSIESKIRGLELGVQDYLTKPIYIREVIARVGIELARQARAGLALKSSDGRTRFSGSLSEMSVVDLLQTIDVSRKSGVLTLISADGQEGMISFDSGAVINATVEDLRGEDAIYRQLLWRDGSFDLQFRRVSLSERTVHRTTQALLMEGMRRLDEWSRLSELLPSFDTVLEVDAGMLRERLREMPDEQNDMVRLIDGERTVAAVLRAHGGDHVEALRKIVDLYFEGMVREVGRVQDSIPVVAEAFVVSSAPPPKEGINTIPGPGGAVKREITVPAAPGIPGVSSTSVTAQDTPSVPAPAREAARDHVTPVSLPSPKIDATDISDDEITAPRATSAPPPALTGPTGTLLPDATRGWHAAPPPAVAPRKRQQTPRGFQQARPEASMSAGRTILNWAGRVPAIEHIEEISSRETVELGHWDHTLSELRDDPDVEEAIEAIDSDPPPAAFIRSTPPSDRVVDEPRKPDQEEQPVAVPEYHEPPEVDPPPLTYEQVFANGSSEASLGAPRPVDPAAARARPEPTPSMLPWALLVLAIVFGAGAVAFVVSQRRVPEETSASTSTMAPAPAPAPAPTSDEGAVQSRQAEATATAPVSPREEAVAEPSGGEVSAPTSVEEPGPTDDLDRIYPQTGAPDTYEAQLSLARRLKRGSRAVAAYRRAIALDPQAAEPLAELARLMLERRHTREATELAERATAIDPSNALAWVTLGAARQMRGDRQGARQAYQNCAKLGKGQYVAECRAMLR
jgi:DNA-binding response OmpR family regulator